MNPPTAEKLQELLSQGRSEQAVVLLQRFDPDVAADLVMSIPYEEQQILFRALPIDFAATLVGHFPYYHSYVLLHSRPAEELRAIRDTTLLSIGCSPEGEFISGGMISRFAGVLVRSGRKGDRGQNLPLRRRVCTFNSKERFPRLFPESLGLILW
jgi:hypothetical protein